ncbi:MAG: TldD/PmbA family protein [Candidatus Bathyarchaeota archaeon]|nr:TldD/PmbA family protein [Candidatus Bathyarchaeota archaeon]MDH5787506.1 TldD/PmbA family protein [Candidatus Bathyarchaeota archaeon]
MEELLEIGKKAINHAKELGTDEAEIFLYGQNLTSVKFASGIFASRGGAVKGIKGAFVRMAEPWIKKKGLPMITSGIKAGVGVRAVIKKAIGFASVSSLEENKVLAAVEEATKIARIRPPDPNWAYLPEAKEPKGRSGIFDKRISELGVEEILDLCADCCVTMGDHDKKITQAIAMLSAAHGSFAVVNTNGISVSDHGTTFVAYFGAKAKSGSEEVSSSDFLSCRAFTENLQSTALNTSKRAIECFGKRSLHEKYVGPVLFENMSWSELFSRIFTYGISASNVQENRSVYKGKIGERVANEAVSIVDDGTMPEGFGTAKIDDEGFPKKKTAIIEKGVLVDILYDNYAAKRDKCESTGNASRQGWVAPPYANQPVIKPSNLMLIPCKGKLEELVSEMKDGVLLKGSLIGAHHSNAMTGDFSVTAENAFRIEDGEVKYPLKACTVAGNLYTALGSVKAIGNDVRDFGFLGNTICPSLVIDKIVVSA